VRRGIKQRDVLIAAQGEECTGLGLLSGVEIILLGHALEAGRDGDLTVDIGERTVLFAQDILVRKEGGVGQVLGIALGPFLLVGGALFPLLGREEGGELAIELSVDLADLVGVRNDLRAEFFDLGQEFGAVELLGGLEVLGIGRLGRDAIELLRQCRWRRRDRAAALDQPAGTVAREKDRDGQNGDCWALRSCIKITAARQSAAVAALRANWLPKEGTSAAARAARSTRSAKPGRS
jgi:hypothetical protein